MLRRLNAGVPDSFDGLFLYTIDDPERGETLGGIEWVGVTESDPDELPAPDRLTVDIPWPTDARCDRGRRGRLRRA